jgi:hypothetical protein
VKWTPSSKECKIHTKSSVEAQAEVTLRLTVSQSVSQYVLVSSPLWTLWSDITSCLKVSVLFLLGRPLWREDGSAVCSLITHWSESRKTRSHTLLSHLRLPQPGGPGSRIYIPLEQGGPVIPPGTGFKGMWDNLTVLKKCTGNLFAVGKDVFVWILGNVKEIWTTLTSIAVRRILIWWWWWEGAEGAGYEIKNCQFLKENGTVCIHLILEFTLKKMKCILSLAIYIQERYGL